MKRIRLVIPPNLRGLRAFLLAASLATGFLASTSEAGDFDNVNAAATDPDGYDPAVFQPVEIHRGFEPNQVFELDGDIESISPSSGNLNLSIPLGQVYTVGPLLSYQLRVTHNSTVWESMQVGCATLDNGCEVTHGEATFMVPNPHSNAGIGWEIHLGKLLPPRPPSGLNAIEKQLYPSIGQDSPHVGERWLYVSPDGSSHDLIPLPGRDNSTGNGPVRYSKDGSRLRMEQIGPGLIEVQHPNGVISEFEKKSTFKGTEFCSTSGTGCWRFKRQYDPRGNEIWISYSKSADNKTEKWQVHDSTGRAHDINFSREKVKTGGGDGAAPFHVRNALTPENPPPDPNATALWDEMGEMERIVTSIRVSVFGGVRKSYIFHYAPKTFTRPSAHDRSVFPGTGSLHSRDLVSIDGPSFDDYAFETDPGGRVKKLTLPTGGQFAYQYGNWDYPTQCVYKEFNFEIEPEYSQQGVVRKQRLNPNFASTDPRNVEAEWVYTDELVPSSINPDDWSGNTCQRAKYRKTVVRAPAGENGHYRKTVYYFSVAEGEQHPLPGDMIKDWRVTDNGLPYAKGGVFTLNETDPNEILFLSQETFDCSSPSSCSKKRQEWVRYATEYRQCNKEFDSPGCFSINPTLVARRTVFRDDGGRWRQTNFKDFNGAGSARLVETKDNFASSGVSRQERTDYSVTAGSINQNPDNLGYFDVGTPSGYLPTTGQPWILHPFRWKAVTEGATTYLSEHQFNFRGELECSRQHRDAGTVPAYGSAPVGNRSRNDLTTKLTFGTVVGTDAGLPTSEAIAGGDTGNLSKTILCSSVGNSAAGSRYVRKHFYEDLQLKQSRFDGSSDFPNLYKAEIDGNTGLASKVFDISDQHTRFFYDALGRLTIADPDDALGAANLNIDYQYGATHRISRATLRRTLPSGPDLTWDRRVFDHFGRFLNHLKTHPTPLANADKVFFEERYDALGRTKSMGTWEWDFDDEIFNNDTRPDDTNTLAVTFRTTFEEIDVFGRPHKVRAPDGQIENRAYAGDRVTTSNVNVATSETGTTNEQTKTLFDSQGRVTEIRTPEYNTAFFYDPLGNVKSSRRVAAGQASQWRVFTWDGRGFLTKEQHPELGSVSSTRGSVIYTRDALGNVRTKNDGTHTLSYQYDGMGRLTSVKEGARTWQEFEYGKETDNTATNFKWGKLTRAVRHNYVGPSPTETDDWEVEETYEYEGVLGQASSRNTTVTNFKHGGEIVTEFAATQAWFYDPLGNVTTTGYPICSAAICSAASGGTPGISASVTTQYNQGLPVRATATGSLRGDYIYHPNFQLGELNYSSGSSFTPRTRTTWELDPQRMQRPRNHRIFQLDSVGNPQGAAIFNAGTYLYDGAGNITDIGSDEYVYDGASRLLKGTVRKAGPARKETYTYDIYDNMLTQTRDSNPPLVFVYDAIKNRQIGSGDKLYDRAGRLTTVGTSHFLEWDALGMQLSHSKVGAAEISIYGPGNLRIASFEAPSQDVTFLVRDLNGKPLRLFLKDDLSAPVIHDRDFFYGPEGLFASRTATAAKRFFHKDHLGTPRLITDDLGGVRGRHDYYAFGQEAGDPSLQYDDRIAKFTGHERDPLGDTDYMLGRTYAFPFNRFLTPDPARDGWNLYAYVANNPIRYVDPNGESPIDAAIGFLDAVGSNFFGGVGRDKPINADFAAGQRAGDIVSIGLGVIEAFVGGAGVLGGLAAEVPSAGTSTVVVANSLVVASHGALVVSTAAGNLGQAISEMRSGGHSSGGGRGRGSNRNDREMVDAAAREVGVDRNKFGKYLEKLKGLEGRRGDENLEFGELIERAKEFKENGA